MPLTDEVCKRRIESLEDFMIRKIEWATDYFIEKKKIPTRHQLSVKAVLRNKTSEQSKKVQQEINQALAEIESRVQSPQVNPE